MSFHSDLAERLGDLVERLTPDEDPAIWAVRACGIIAEVIGNEDVDPTELRTALEALYVLCPDKVVEASATMRELIIDQGEIK